MGGCAGGLHQHRAENGRGLGTRTGFSCQSCGSRTFPGERARIGKRSPTPAHPLRPNTVPSEMLSVQKRFWLIVLVVRGLSHRQGEWVKRGCVLPLSPPKPLPPVVAISLGWREVGGIVVRGPGVRFQHPRMGIACRSGRQSGKRSLLQRVRQGYSGISDRSDPSQASHGRTQAVSCRDGSSHVAAAKIGWCALHLRRDRVHRILRRPHRGMRGHCTDPARGAPGRRGAVTQSILASAGAGDHAFLNRRTFYSPHSKHSVYVLPQAASPIRRWNRADRTRDQTPERP